MRVRRISALKKWVNSRTSAIVTHRIFDVLLGRCSCATGYRIRLSHLHDHKTCGGEENPADEDGREMDRRECGKEEQDQ